MPSSVVSPALPASLPSVRLQTTIPPQNEGAPVAISSTTISVQTRQSRSGGSVQEQSDGLWARLFGSSSKPKSRANFALVSALVWMNFLGRLQLNWECGWLVRNAGTRPIASLRWHDKSS